MSFSKSRLGEASVKAGNSGRRVCQCPGELTGPGCHEWDPRKHQDVAGRLTGLEKRLR